MRKDLPGKDCAVYKVKKLLSIFAGIVAVVKILEDLMDTRPRLEGSYKIGSVHPSVLPCRLSVSFVGIGLLVFSKSEHDVRGTYIVVCDRAGFFGKLPIRQKWPKNRVLGFFKKITSLFLSGICVK